MWEATNKRLQKIEISLILHTMKNERMFQN